MYRDHTIGVVVPAYNEEGLIGEVIRSMPAFIDWICVVDDCSVDGTWNEVLAAAQADRDEVGSAADSTGTESTAD